MQHEEKVSLDVCESEFERFCEAMDLDVNPDEMDAEDKTAFEQAKRRIVKAMRTGALVINDEGEPVYTPQRGEQKDPITFHEPDGASLMAIDQVKAKHEMAKTNAVLAAITKESSARFAKMLNRDLKVCQSIMVLYMGG